MNQSTIDQAFQKMIGTHRIHQKLGITPGHVKVLRYQVKKGIHISLDKKHRLLRKSGWQMDHHRWTDQDIMDAIKFTIKSGQMAKQFGASYLLEKWKNSTA